MATDHEIAAWFDRLIAELRSNSTELSRSQSWQSLVVAATVSDEILACWLLAPHADDKPTRCFVVASRADLLRRADELVSALSPELGEGDRWTNLGPRHLAVRTWPSESVALQLYEWLGRYTDESALDAATPSRVSRIGGIYRVRIPRDLPDPVEFAEGVMRIGDPTVGASGKAKRVATAKPTSLKATQVQPANVGRQGSACYLTPPVSFGRPTSPSLRDRMQGLWTPGSSATVLGTARTANGSLWLHSNGLLVCDVAASEPAMNLLNQVAAALTRGGVPSFEVGANELIEVRSFSGPGVPSMTNASVTPRYRAHMIQALALGQSWSTEVLAAEDAAQALEVAQRVAASAAQSHKSLRLLSSHTLFLREHYTEAFLVAWAIIEFAIQSEFDSYWLDVGRSKTWLSSVQRDWTTSLQLDLLLALGKVKPDQAEALHSLRKKRNRVVHQMETAAREEALTCLEQAYRYADLEAPLLSKPAMALVF